MTLVGHVIITRRQKSALCSPATLASPDKLCRRRKRRAHREQNYAAQPEITYQHLIDFGVGAVQQRESP